MNAQHPIAVAAAPVAQAAPARSAYDIELIGVSKSYAGAAAVEGVSCGFRGQAIVACSAQAAVASQRRSR
jgi:hypothetical protein